MKMKCIILVAFTVFAIAALGMCEGNLSGIGTLGNADLTGCVTPGHDYCTLNPTYACEVKSLILVNIVNQGCTVYLKTGQAVNVLATVNCPQDHPPNTLKIIIKASGIQVMTFLLKDNIIANQDSMLNETKTVPSFPFSGTFPGTLSMTPSNANSPTYICKNGISIQYTK